MQQEGRLVLAASPIAAGDFEAWKQSVPMALPDNGRQPKNVPHPYVSAAETPQASVTAVPPAGQGCENLADSIRRFNIESKTPVECMLFLMELKRRLAE